MDKETFIGLRTKLGKTQKALADLLGISLKAVQSYEQGWRSIPLHAEQRLYFFAASQRHGLPPKRKECWAIKRCGRKATCPAWEFQAGQFCWIIGGVQCESSAAESWEEKIAICSHCEVLTSLL